MTTHQEASLLSWLRYALDNWAPAGSEKAEKARQELDAAERGERTGCQFAHCGVCGT